MTQRITYLDSLRGFAILLVIIGHFIQYNYESSIRNDIFNIIYSFHMPLFFFLSGCTRSLQEDKKGSLQSWRELLAFYAGKFMSLLLPSIAWTLLVPFFFSREWGLNGSISSFWFLNVLFAVSCVWTSIRFFDNKIRKWNIFFWITITVLVILFAIDMKRVPIMYFTLYVFGYFFQKKSWLQKWPDYIYEIALFVFLLAVGYFSYGQTLYGDGDRVCLEIPLSILASICLTKLFSNIKNKLFNTVFILFGQYSLGIYLTHFLMVEIPYIGHLEYTISEIMQFLILSVLAIITALCCILIEKATEAFPNMHKILYGKN